MKTGIVIITYNIETRLFLLQIEAIRKFCKDDFVIEIIDNSTDKEVAEAIKYHCGILDINYRKTFANTEDASQSHSFSANLSYHIFKDQYDILFYLDHDCIPVAPFSCDEILKNKLMAGLAQQKAKKYFWPGCFMFRNTIQQSLIDFSPNREFELDTGGNLYQLIEKYGGEKCVFFSEAYFQNTEYSGNGINYFSEINGTFWHCIGASNWFNISDNDKRINAFINVVNDKING